MAKSGKSKIDVEKLKVEGSQLVGKIKEIISEGTASRVIITKDDKVMLEVPLAIGVGGATAAILLAPVLAAVGAFAALVSDVDIMIERASDDDDDDDLDSE